jgi:outer membrane immunogenic protein
MKKSTFHKAAFCVAILCTAGLAFAGSEPVVETKPAPEPYNWTGLHIGGNIGGILSYYDFSAFNEFVDAGSQFGRTPVGAFITGTVPLDIRFPVPSKEQHEGSVIGGGQIGYDFQFGHWVIGVEGDFDRTSVEAAREFRDTFVGTGTIPILRGIDTTTQVDFLRTAETNWTASARLRLGWAYNQFLFYGTGGGSWTDVNIRSQDIASSTFNDPAIFGFAGTVRDTHVSRSEDTLGGWTAGAGIEFAVFENVTMGLEYRHAGYGSTTRDFHRKNRILPGDVDVDLDTDMVVAKMNINLSHMWWTHQMATTTATDAKDYKASKNVAVMPVEDFNWSGLYLGVQGGGNWSDYKYRGFDSEVDVENQLFGGPGVSSFRVPFTNPDFGNDPDDSIQGGGQVGYNFQFGHWVFGVEGDFTGVSSRAHDRFVSNNLGLALFGTFDTLTNLTTEQSLEQNWNASARARVGWAKGPVLLYLTGGAAWVDVTSRLKQTASTDFFSGGGFVTNVTSVSGSQSEDVNTGWTAGGGAEWAFNDLFSVGMEYRHNEFDNVGTGIRRQGPFIFSEGSSADLNSDQLMVRFNVLLGRVHPH